MSNREEKLSSSCGICQESERDNSGVAKLITTPCYHPFHLNCLKKIIHPSCPLCRNDLSSFLITNGVTEQEMKEKVNNESLRLCCQGLEEVDPSSLTTEEIMTIATMSQSNSTDWSYVYRDIILDQIANACLLFNRISELKTNDGQDPGLFVYYLPVQSFRQDMINPHSKSQVQWAYLSTFYGLPNFEVQVRQLIKRIRNKATEFAVLIVWEDQQVQLLSPRLMSSTLEGNAKIMIEFKSHAEGQGYIAGCSSSRIAQRDIVKTLMRTQTCRCSGPSPNDPNREYKWAKAYLHRLEQKKLRLSAAE